MSAEKLTEGEQPSKSASKSKQLEIELRLFIDNRLSKPEFVSSYRSHSPDTTRDLAKFLLKSLEPSSIEISQTINQIQGAKSDINLIRQLYFINGVQQHEKKKFYKKQVLFTAFGNSSRSAPSLLTFKFSVSLEDESGDLDPKPEIARIKLRISMLSDCLGPDWRFDLTLVRNSIIDRGALQSAKDALFGNTVLTSANFAELAPWDAAESIEFELEFIGANFTLESALKAVKAMQDHLDIFATAAESSATGLPSIKSAFGTQQGAQQSYVMNKLANLMTAISPNQRKSRYPITIKQISPQVRELTKRLFFTKEKFALENYYVTDKADGLRDLLLVEMADANASTGTHTSATCKIYSASRGELASFEIANAEIASEFHQMLPFILDCEYVNQNTYYAFDTPSKDHLKQRLDRMKTVIDVLASTGFAIEQKVFINLAEAAQSSHKAIAEFYAASRPYEIDGLIFTEAYGTYFDQSYKWKPPEKLTIDFLMKQCPQNLVGIEPYVSMKDKTLYLLHVGVSRRVFEARHCKRPASGITPPYNAQYFAIPFAPLDKPYAYLYWSSDSTLDGKICEIGPSPNTNQWSDEFRIREDRTPSSTYFGNDLIVAESIWSSYRSPLTFDMLIGKEVPKSYFNVKTDEKTINSRNYARFVISQLFKRINGANWVIDLGSGNGQDLFRYAENKVRNVLFVEKDKDAITELLSRRQQLTQDRHCMQVQVCETDLTLPWKENFNRIYKGGYGIPPTLDAIVCNLALHYFIGSPEAMDNVLALITALKPKTFMYTAFDGKNLFKLLKAGKGKFTAGPYMILRDYVNPTFTGISQGIKVQLPFASEPVFEYLVDSDTIAKKLAKLGYKRLFHDSFSTWGEACQRENPKLYDAMTEDDKLYTGLYWASCFISA